MDKDKEISPDAIDKKTLTISSGNDCTHPAGHCFGSDGGTGIPVDLKVDEKLGGEIRVQEISQDKKTLLEDAFYEKCQYCGKCKLVETKAQRDAKEIVDSNADAQKDIDNMK